MRNQKRIQPLFQKQSEFKHIGTGENGSIIVIALIILAILTLGGICATHRSVSESFIVRNAGMQIENQQLADTAAMIGLREVLQLDANVLQNNAFPEIWMHRASDWNDNPFDPQIGDSDSYPLDDNNSAVPVGITDADPNNDIAVINIRGEANEGNIRYYFVGWGPVAGESITLDQSAMWRSGRIIGDYNSNRFGRKTVEIGLIRRF